MTVSILTPCYNQGREIAVCIESVLAQTYQHWELIVVDDGSNDGTPDVAEAYRDARIKVVRLPHRGLEALAETYNEGFARASGSLIAVLEGDDAWPADKLAVQIAAFDNPGVQLSWGRATAIDGAGQTIRRLSTVRTVREFVDFQPTKMFGTLVRTNIIAPAASVMVRREALEAIGGFRQDGSSHYVDLPTWLALAAKNQGLFRFVNHELALYRVHGAQVSQRFAREMSAEVQRIVAALVSRLSPQDLRRLDWERVHSHAQIAAKLARGQSLLRNAQFADARAEFLQSLSGARRGADVAKALLGACSAIIHRDLLSPLFRFRERYLAGS